MQNFAARLVDRLGPNACLIDAPDREVISAESLRRAIARFAGAFAAAGLRTGDRVLIGCTQTPASSIAYLGAMYGGFVPVPVHERVLEHSGAAILRKSAARSVWTTGDFVGDWAYGANCVHLQGRVDREWAKPVSPAECAASDLAALMTTSGSTGTPQLVRVTHSNLVANTEAIIRSQSLRADERAMLVLPVSYCFGASVLHTHLYRGGGVVFDSRFMFPDKVLRAISQYACTTFAGVPTAYSILLRRSNIRSIPLPTVRRFLQAGGALPWDQVQQMRQIAPHADFFVMYGQTEATSRISCLPPGRIADKSGSVGLPLDNVRVRIVSESGSAAEPGQVGEIQAFGEAVCDGYFDDPAATAETFRGRWLSTGDVGFRDADGYLWIVGRKSEFLKMRGVRVSFAEVESRIAAVRGVAECAATAVAHPEAGEALALYVVAHTSAGDLGAEIRHAMPEGWICDCVRFVRELPKNPNGKLVRSLLGDLMPVRVIRWTPRVAHTGNIGVSPHALSSER